MGGDKAERIEAAVGRLAAAVFAAAAGFAAWKFVAGEGFAPWAFAVPAGALGYLLCLAISRSVPAGVPEFRLPEFAPANFEPVEWSELLLTEQVELVLTCADRVAPPIPLPEELLLDDILAEIEPDSRVVRLFDPNAMPTPAQLNAQIVRHLNRGTAPAEPPDASQALYDALAELRRSLR